MESETPEIRILRLLVDAAEEGKIDPGDIIVFSVMGEDGIEVMDLHEVEGVEMRHLRALERKRLILLHHRRGAEYRARLKDAAFRFVEAPDPIPSNAIALTSTSLQDPFVAQRRIDELRAVKSLSFDLRRLVQMCKELNRAAAHGDFIAMGALQRTIINHVPPIWDKKNFESVASQVGGRSFQKHMTMLQESLKNVADQILHRQIGPQSRPVEYADIAFRAATNELIQMAIDEMRSKGDGG